MSRRVRRKVVRKGKEKLGCGPDNDENLILDDREMLDWTRLPDDTVIQLFSCLNYRDRASLSSTCRTWRTLGKSPCLWQVLDLRPHKCDSAIARSLANRCENLLNLRFRGPESADAIMNLQAKNLREIRGDNCRKLTDATLSVLVARHEALECLQIEPDYCFCDRISSDSVKSIALCCPNLKTLRLSGIHDVSADAINALAKHCKRLTDIGFIDCRSIDETSLANVASLCYLSVAGTVNIKWHLAAEEWSKLPHLIGLDVSRTDINPDTVSRLFSSSLCLKVLCALSCPGLEGDATFVSTSNHKGKFLLASFTDILNQVGSLFVNMPKSCTNVFLDWRKFQLSEKKFEDIMNWLEWIISYSLLRVSENNPPGLDNFWLNQGTTLMLSLVQSMNEEVQERAATALATFVITDDDSSGIDVKRADAVMQNGGIRILLNLAQSWSEGLQSEAAKAIANLSVNSNVAKAVADEGGISLLTGLARSKNRMVAEEAAGGLWNLSVGEEHKVAIAEVGAVQALVDLIFKWSKSTGGESVLERAAGALANIAADDKCSMEVASVGGVHALVMLARDFKVEGVQEQSARALANLAAHGDSNCNNAAVGREAGSIDALVQLTRSSHEGVRQEAAGALWNLSFDDTNREEIAAVGGIEALVSLALSCPNASHGLQERAAGALWGLSVSEANSIAIGQEGGIPPLITLARSDAEDVHETAAGALWNLAFNPGNALRIVEEGGVPVLVNLCSSVSKMARFMSALAMAYMFDGRMEEIAMVGTSTDTSKTLNLEGTRRMALKNIEAFVKSFSNPPAFAAAAASSAPAALAIVTESARLHEAGQLRCSRAEIGRFVAMLRNPCPTLKSCAAFALLQFTVQSSRHSAHHASLLQNAGAPRILRAAAAAANAPIEAKIFARIVLRNLEQHQVQNIC